MPRNHPASRSTARFGSQGSRVNENGSPCGNSNSLKDQTNYKAIVRKVLTDKRSQQQLNGEDNCDSFLHYDDDEGLNVVESDQGFVLNLPATSSS